jgi:2'-5' RNA ligase
MRCFIAIELPEHVKSKVFHEIEKLQTAEGISGNFVEKDNLHLTLKFLGDISEEEIENIGNKLNELKFKEFEIQLGGYGFFPSADYIRVVWVGVNSSGLCEFESKISKIFSKHPSTYEKFDPHLTMGRIKNIRDKDSFLKLVGNLKKIDEKFTADKIVLMKSELTSNGPKYKVLKEFF